jgi:DNA polymerase III delta prime subunit
MRLAFDDFLKNYKDIPHHAILLTSRDFFGKVSLDFKSFQELLKHFSKISLPLLEESSEELWMDMIKHPDVHILSGFLSPIKINDVLKFVSLSRTPPLLGEKRTFFIDHADNMTVSAANALLKSLEEPEINCLFLMTTAFPHMMLPTIRSRMMSLNLSFKKGTVSSSEKISKIDLKSLKDFVSELKPVSVESSIKLNNKNKVKEDFAIQDLNKIIELSFSLAGKYTDSLIRDTVITLLSERLKENNDLISSVKFILGFLFDWKNTQALNPNHSLWLARILIAIKNSG